MVEFDFDVTDLDEAVGRAMDALDQQISVAWNLGGDLIANDARGTSAFVDRSGALRNSIQSTGASGEFSAGNLHVDVTYAATSDDGYPYGIAINDGSRPHVIRARRRKRLRIPLPNGFAFPESVNHPGTEATRFADDALEGRVPKIVQLMEQAAELGLRKAGF